LENWFEVEFLLLKLLRLQPSELDRMEFYRAEILMEHLKDWSEKEQKQRKKEEENQTSSMNGYDMGSMQRNANQMMKNSTPTMPSMPNMGSFKM
jgi:hypothetical protein